MENEIFPLGTIICNTQSYFLRRMPVWGIVLPKKPFLELFQKEKGPWPTGEIYYDGNKYNDLIFNKFGGYLPIEINGVPNPSSYSSKDTQIILPPKFFLEDQEHIGTKCFGGIMSPTDKRKLSLEVMSSRSHVIPFDLKQLKLIDIIRQYTLEETGCDPHHTHDVAFEMETIIKYFSGEFKNYTQRNMEYDVSPLWILNYETLIFCKTWKL
ncbi:MAG: hypothetical protein NT139_00670 [Candidatus Woesearchaeota archaeon]|nr:hypothetical protein [Candidatus Woesearchaeota archaeon]